MNFDNFLEDQWCTTRMSFFDFGEVTISGAVEYPHLRGSRLSRDIYNNSFNVGIVESQFELWFFPASKYDHHWH